MKINSLIATAFVALMAVPAQAQLRYTPPAPIPVPVVVPSYPTPAPQRDLDDRDQVTIGLAGAPKREATIIQMPLAPIAADPQPAPYQTHIPAPPATPAPTQTAVQPSLSATPPIAILVPPSPIAPVSPSPVESNAASQSQHIPAPPPPTMRETPVLEAAREAAQAEPARPTTPQQKPVDGCLSTDISRTWTVEAGKTLRQELRRWAKEVCWTTVFRTADDYPFAAGASFDGTFINAIQALFEDLRTMEPIPTATLYTGNKVILVSTQANPQGE